MPTIEFTGVKLKNFRCFSDLSLPFPPGPVHIVGDNGQGKSTMAEAVIFALYGVTVTGSSKSDDLIQQGAESCAVELGLTVVGKPHTVARSKGRSENGSKIWIDGVKSNQAGILKLIGLDQKEFLSLFNPAYFLSWVESDQKGAQDFFTRLIPKLDPLALTAKLSQGFRDDLDEDMLADIPGNLTKLNKQKDALEAQKTFLAGQVSEIERQLQAPEAPVDDEVPVRARLAELAQSRSTLLIPDRPVPPVPLDAAAIRAQINTLTATRNAVQTTVLPQEPQKTCAACGSVLTGQVMEKAVATWQDNKKRLADANTKIMLQRGQLAAQIKLLEEQAAQAGRKNKEEAEAYPKALTDWEKQTKKAREDLAAIDNETVGLNEQLGQITAAKEAKKKRDESRARLKDLQKQQGEIEAQVKTLTNQVNALKQASKAAAEMLAEQIQGYLDHVSLKLFDLVKSTGEVKPAFRILYDSKPTPFLSFSERSKAGLELRQLVAALRDITVPTFIDNKESISVLPDLGDTQVFHAEVWKGAELAVLGEKEYLAALAQRKLEEYKELAERMEQVESAA